MWMADPHVISALREKRAELSGELIAAENRIVQLRADIGLATFTKVQPLPDMLALARTITRQHGPRRWR
jgi:hypothetical protein